MPKSKIESWIAQNVNGHTFCDIGGIGLDCQNERISCAIKNGASQATMIDFRQFGFPEWDVFDHLVQRAEFNNVSSIDNANLEDVGFPELTGSFDFVHSTGILYHAPSPIQMIHNLSKITNKYLVVNTVIAPEKIDTDKGSLDYTGSKVLFLPGLSDREREILELYYQKLLGWKPGKFSSFTPKLGDTSAPMPYLQYRAKDERYFWRDEGNLSYTPYWFLFSKDAFKAAVMMMGFEILDEQSFKGHTLGLFCKRIADN